MVITKTYDINIPNSFTLRPNDEYVLDLSSITNLYTEKVVLLSGIVKIFVNLVSPLLTLSIYSRSGNYDTLYEAFHFPLISDIEEVLFEISSSMFSWWEK